jgi:2-phosphosulfolactate phosphatase
MLVLLVAMFVMSAVAVAGDGTARSVHNPKSEIRIPVLLAVHYLPQFVDESELAESVVVVVDQLRASSTICHALSAGATCVMPFVEVDHALAEAEKFTAGKVLLGGERGGRRITGFQLGNSPTEYTPEKVFAQTIIFTTTNGARALNHARLAEQVLVGATVNRQAIVTHLAQAQRVDILCAGTNGAVTREDILAAGAIADGLLQRLQHESETNEWADAAQREWQELLATAHALGRSPSQQLARELRETSGGKNLLAIGHDEDLDVCAQLDTLDVVPEFNLATGEIRG